MTLSMCRKSRAWALLVVLSLLWTAGCSNKYASDDTDDPASIGSEDEAQRVQLQFEGVFRNESTVYDTVVITELELREEGLQQRRNDQVVFDAPCTKTVRSTQRVDFDCASSDDNPTRWPLAFTEDGALFHRAMPEMVYTRVEPDANADSAPDVSSDTDSDDASAPENP